MSQGNKFDQGKPRMDLLSPIALTEIAKVMTMGIGKYGEHNWRKGLQWSRIIAATMRHLNKFNSGIDVDEESGLSHVAHAACNLLMLLEYERTHTEMDDRFKYDQTKGQKRARVSSRVSPKPKGRDKKSKKTSRKNRQASKKIRRVSRGTSRV